MEETKNKKAVKILRGIAGTFTGLMGVLFLVIMIVAIVASTMFSQTISIFLGHDTSKIKGGDGTQYYESSFSSPEQMVKRQREVCEEIMNEGIVLMKNENQVLPLKENAKVSVFGQDSVDLVYGGTGSGSVDSSTAVKLNEGLNEAGITINPVLWDFYESGEGSSYRKSVPSVTGSGDVKVNEVPQSVYTQEVKDSYKDYNDAAIVVFGRSGGEVWGGHTAYFCIQQYELYFCEKSIYRNRSNRNLPYTYYV